mgnify:FL=1|tara:strand:- start:1998 stop:2840 length:843 start_codon:yes stop_codon:yes gene_type:complete
MIKFICDFTLEESRGGAEFVDNTVIGYLGAEVVKSSELVPSKDEFYVLSNTSLMKQENLDFIRDNCKYIILEHDYKIVQSRHPWRYSDNIVPESERINYGLYENAIATFVQSDDHRKVFKDNEVPGVFISLSCSIWSELELNTLEMRLLNRQGQVHRTHEYAVVESDNWIKNTKQAVELCESHKLDYKLIKANDYEPFLRGLSQYTTLVFLPLARETLCRLIVEARCLTMNVITNQNSGAWNADWYGKTGMDLIKYLRTTSRASLNIIKETTYESITIDR